MTYLLYIGALFGGLIKKHSRFMELVILIVIWMLASFASGNADSGIYESRYNFYWTYTGMSEVGWQALMIAFNALGVEYQVFRCILIATELVLLRFAVHRLSDEPCFVLVMYLLFPFCLDVVQMRFALAEVIAFFGMSFFFEPIVYGKGRKHSKVLFVVLTIVASTFHFIAIVYLILLLVPRLNTVGSLLAIPLLSIAFVVLVHWSGLANLASVVGLETKFENVVSAAGNLSQIVRYGLNIVLFTGTWCLIFSAAPGAQQADGARHVAIVVNWIIFAVTISLLFLSVDFYRLQQGITLLNLCFLSRYVGPEIRMGFSKRNAAIILLAGGVSAMNLFLYVLSNTNFEQVFLPLFQSNLLLAS